MPGTSTFSEVVRNSGATTSGTKTTLNKETMYKYNNQNSSERKITKSSSVNPKPNMNKQTTQNKEKQQTHNKYNAEQVGHHYIWCEP